MQYNASTHRLGGNFERATTACAVCHTHEGFLERLPTNAQATAAEIINPSPINCRTCHQIHKTFTAADYALTATTPFALFDRGATVDLGSQAGNLCGRCHQSRPIAGMPVLGGADVKVTSSRYGFHHGPQANVLASKGAYAFSGTATIPTTSHVHGDPAFNAGTCAACHMQKAYGSQSGGHTWKMSYDYHGTEVENIAACQECHKTVTNFDHFGLRPTVKQLLADLNTELVRLGIRPVTTDPTNYYAVVGTYKADIVAAFINWQLFSEDRSSGMHNPPYVKGVLVNTIAKMKTY
ncbi:MAG: hypothetical protein ACYC6F_13390 [Longimicrobiales bacterium]